MVIKQKTLEVCEVEYSEGMWGQGRVVGQESLKEVRILMGKTTEREPAKTQRREKRYFQEHGRQAVSVAGYRMRARRSLVRSEISLTIHISLPIYSYLPP